MTEEGETGPQRTFSTPFWISLTRRSESALASTCTIASRTLPNFRLPSGAIPLVAALCLRSWPEKPLKGFFIRKENKGHGTDQQVDGLLDPGSRVILFEDVTTTGGSALRAVDEARRNQCTILKVITVVDRLEGAEENFRTAGVPFEALFIRRDFD